MRKLLIILLLFVAAKSEAQTQMVQPDLLKFLRTGDTLSRDTVFLGEICYMTLPGQYADRYKVRDTATNTWREVEVPNQGMNARARKQMEDDLKNNFKDTFLVQGKDTFRYRTRKMGYWLY